MITPWPAWASPPSEGQTAEAPTKVVASSWSGCASESFWTAVTPGTWSRAATWLAGTEAWTPP